mgnify:FL=1
MKCHTIYRNLALALSKLHINVDITVGFFVGQKNYRLHVLRLREQVYRAELGGAPAEAGEGGDVAGEGLGVAADIDDAARLHFVDCRDALRRTARAGRVKEHYIRVQALPGRGGHPFGGVGADKAGICNFVAAGAQHR